MLEDNTNYNENGDENTVADDTFGEKTAETTGTKFKKGPRHTYGTIDMEGTIVLLADNKNKITKFRGNTLRDRIKIGGILEHSQKKLAKHEGGTKFYKAWVKDVLRMSSTDAINARRLHKLFTGTFKPELKALDLEYRNALNYSIVETALFAWENVLNPPKGGSPKKGTRLVSLEFLPREIVVKFEGSEEEHELSKMSVRGLKKLLDPSTKTPQVKKARQTVSALQELLDRAREDNEALKLQLKELTEKIMLFQGGASPVAEPETPADVIAPSESNPGGESIDALVERIESAFVDAGPDTVETGIAPEGGEPDGGVPKDIAPEGGHSEDGEPDGGVPKDIAPDDDDSDDDDSEGAVPKDIAPEGGHSGGADSGGADSEGGEPDGGVPKDIAPDDDDSDDDDSEGGNGKKAFEKEVFKMPWNKPIQARYPTLTAEHAGGAR